MSMPENLCNRRANIPPEAMRENPLSCKYIEGHCALAKRLVNQSCRSSGYGFRFVWQKLVVQDLSPPISFIDEHRRVWVRVCLVKVWYRRNIMIKISTKKKRQHCLTTINLLKKFSSWVMCISFKIKNLA
jgi:hypothetical protein